MIRSVGKRPIAVIVGRNYWKSVREIIKHVIAPDGQTRVAIHRRTDGRFEFSYDKFYVDDIPEYNHRMEYWAPGQPSGIFDSAETAIREASLEFPWVSDPKSESGN